MPLSSSQAAEFREWGKPAPEVIEHGNHEDIRAGLMQQAGRAHGSWHQVGTEIHCNDCEHGHGFHREPVDANGKHWIFAGTDAEGHPTFKEITPKPNNWHPPKPSKAKKTT
jgi:hypothetical protein